MKKIKAYFCGTCRVNLGYSLKPNRWPPRDRRLLVKDYSKTCAGCKAGHPPVFDNAANDEIDLAVRRKVGW